MATRQNLYLLLLVLLVFFLPGNGVHAFGAGNIPGYVVDLSRRSVWISFDDVRSYGHLKGKAFRHGDIVSMHVCTFKDSPQPHHRKQFLATCSNVTV